MIQKTYRECIASIPVFQEKPLLRNSILTAGFAILFFSGLIAGGFTLLLKYHAYHTAYYDGPNDTIRMVFSQPSNTAIIATAVSVFGVSAISGIGSVFLSVQKMLKDKDEFSFLEHPNLLLSDEVIAKKIHEVTGKASGVIFGVGSIGLLITLLAFGISSCLKNDIHINNEKILALKKIADTYNSRYLPPGYPRYIYSWQDCLPNFKGSDLGIRDVSLNDLSLPSLSTSFWGWYFFSLMFGALLIISLSIGIGNVFFAISNETEKIKKITKKILEMKQEDRNYILEQIKKNEYRSLSNEQIRNLVAAKLLPKVVARKTIATNIARRRIGPLLSQHVPSSISNLIIDYL